MAHGCGDAVQISLQASGYPVWCRVHWEFQWLVKGQLMPCENLQNRLILSIDHNVKLRCDEVRQLQIFVFNWPLSHWVNITVIEYYFLRCHLKFQIESILNYQWRLEVRNNNRGSLTSYFFKYHCFYPLISQLQLFLSFMLLMLILSIR